MSAPKVTVVTEGSPAAAAGLRAGDELVSINGHHPRDVIEYHQLVDEPELQVVVRRPGAPLDRAIRIEKHAGQPLGIEVASAVFDRVRTCDNHCAFCFIYQLPKGMRRSLYLKDDDYRLSFLYGNFTTLTRFTELDVERVVTERLSPLYVSIHTTDPALRAEMLRNPKGATSLRWLRALLDAGIEVHGQLVVCPGVNDGPALETTLAGILDEYPELASVGAVPLGVSRYSTEPAMRPHTRAEAEAVVDTVGAWQDRFVAALGRRMVFCADEYYLLTDRPFPPLAAYEGTPQHENGIGMAATFAAAFAGDPAADTTGGVRHGFFAAVDGAPAEGYRAPRHDGGSAPAGPVPDGPVTILTGAYGARVLAPLVGALGRDDVEVRALHNATFGGNICVTGLLAGTEVGRALTHDPPAGRVLLPDVCLSGDRFLDGCLLGDLPRAVEVVPTDGASLRVALEAVAVPA